jgi:hypothetical protein
VGYGETCATARDWACSSPLRPAAGVPSQLGGHSAGPGVGFTLVFARQSRMSCVRAADPCPRRTGAGGVRRWGSAMASSRSDLVRNRRRLHGSAPRSCACRCLATLQHRVHPAKANAHQTRLHSCGVAHCALQNRTQPSSFMSSNSWTESATHRAVLPILPLLVGHTLSARTVAASRNT